MPAALASLGPQIEQFEESDERYERKRTKPRLEFFMSHSQQGDYVAH
jgi:hypothetical protein